MSPDSNPAPLPPAPAPPLPRPLCPGDRPLVLLPVRLETRYFMQPSGTTELRVRVYPDKIHLDTHEPELLPTEQQWGAHYWELNWRAGNDELARATAWRQLADRFGAARAAWIARCLQPVNQALRPDAPTRDGQALRPAPVLPAVTVVNDGHNSAWRRAPLARLLPDRWVAVWRLGNATVQVTGRDIPRSLPAGPDPKFVAGAVVPDDQLSTDPGMKWMIDFDAAEAKGMGLRLTLPPAFIGAANASASLLVYGVAASAGSDAAQQLAQLLDAHHYTDGLGFLRLGTPTNNSDDRRAAPTADDATHERSYALEVKADPAQLDAASNAMRLGAALGMAPAAVPVVLGRVAEAASSHEADLRSMNVALWPVGWGYYLGNLVGFDGTGLDASGLAWAREHFTRHVRFGGPLPLLRCGRQPYGVLPVTSLDLWQPSAGEEAAAAPDIWLRGLLLGLRNNVWRARLPEAFRIGRRSDPTLGPDADLADVMRTDAVSGSYRTRAQLGRHYLHHLRAFMGEDLQASGFLQTADALVGGVLQRLGLNRGHPRIAQLVADGRSWPVSSPLVQAGEVSPWRKLEPNYIATLLATPRIDDLVAARPGAQSAPADTSLLHQLLRHALLRELAEAAALIAASGASGNPAAQASLAASLRRDAELVDLVTGAALTPTFARQLALQVPAVTGSATIRQFLESLSRFDTPAVAALGELRAALAHLRDLDSETLQLLMQGTLDLSAHRLDAWITSFATKRLAAMTAGGASGAYVGGYGWVENLRPTPPSAVALVTTPPPGEEGGELRQRTKDTGFIHAPSLTHAAAAALLRNAHLGASDQPGADSPFAVNLSSRRVRESQRLLDGLRQGQRLGALLGYRLERSLHDMGLDKFIAPLRKLAPLVSTLSDSSAVQEAVAANNVVDGLQLSRLWHDHRSDVEQAVQTLYSSINMAGDLAGALDALAEAIDGLGDALTAESAYQMARGNTTRVASTLAAVSQGDAPPPELEVARTPRSGTALTHRLLVLMSGTPGAMPGWMPWTAGMRSAAEPMLNYWASMLLGPANKVRCTVERLDLAGAVLETRRFPLSDLAVSPLDVVYGVGAGPGAASAADTPTEIEQWVLYNARHRVGGFDAAATLRLQHARPADLAAGELTLFDLLEQARALRRLLGGIRGAEPEDLNPPERLGSGVLDLVDLNARVVRSEDALNAAHKALAALVAKPATATAEALRTGLMKLGAFGVGPATPSEVSGESPAIIGRLIAQAQGLMKDSAARIERITALRAATAAADPRARRDQLVDRMHAVYGAGFVVLPRFNVGSAGATELGSALAASPQTLGGDALAANAWLARCARVRDAAARLGHGLRGAEVLGVGERLNLAVAQLPLVAGQRWVGLPPLPGKPLPAGKLSLVCQLPAALNLALPLTGLLVDEWIETVPAEQETTALTFQFDPPDAAPPQSLLVAVPPVPGADWTAAMLQQVLDETLNLARLRTLDSEMLGEVAQVLPALSMAFNAHDDVVSTDFAPLTR